MPARLAPRVAQIAPFQVMELVARCHQLEAAGRDVIHLEIGEPDFPVAPEIIDAATGFLARGRVRYTPTGGIPELRAALSRHYAERFNVSIPVERILVTAGASAGLQLILAALVAPGETWLQPDPGYPCNRHFISLYEGIPKLLVTAAESGFQPTPEQVESAWDASTRGVILASPANPTGTTLPAQALAGIRDEVRRRNGHVVVDEIYQGLTYDAPPSTALSLGEDVFVINSFSKYFGMTGWRLGWLVAPPDYVRAIEKLAQNIYICASTVAQHAALGAFSPSALGEFERRRIAFEQRRNVLCDGLERLGFTIPARPDGAFYVYADCSGLGVGSMQLSQRLLEEAGVAVTPGLDFGHAGADRYLRFAYTTDVERITDALKRIAHLLN